MSLDVSKFKKAYYKDANLRNMIDRLKEEESRSLSTESKELSKIVMDKRKLTDSDMAYMRLTYGTPLTISDDSYSDKHPFTPDSYKEVIENERQYSNVEDTVGNTFIALVIMLVFAMFATVVGMSEETIKGISIIGFILVLIIWIMHGASFSR